VKIEVEIVGDNPFNEGWLKFILGLDAPGDPAGRDGWNMAKDSVPLRSVRQVFTRQPAEHPQYRVHELDVRVRATKGALATDE
jgi:hypothetical protein